MTNFEWLVERVGHQGDECLTWPFARVRGYGQVKAWGKIRKAHRVMCQLAHGEPPSAEHHAAHSCGRGHLGCVHSGHLSWKTPKENAMDKTLHGTHGRKTGSCSPLTRDQYSEILALKGFVPVDQLAVLHGVSRRTIQQIHGGRVYKRFKRAA